jgi:nicotinamidase-related amidase
MNMVKVLVVVDMQNDFIDGALGTKEAQAIVPRVLFKIKHHEGPILFTKDTHGGDYLESQEGHKLPVPHCLEGTHGWELEKEIRQIAEKNENLTFTKETFGSKDMVEYLVDLSRKIDIEEIELIGLCTDICVISNALSIKTFLPEVPIKVDGTCCAGVTVESHNNALSAMRICQIEVSE